MQGLYFKSKPRRKFGLYKFIANALDITYDDWDSDKNTGSNYPCQVVNFYSCPFEDTRELN